MLIESICVDQSDKDASNWSAGSVQCLDSARGTVDVRAGLQRLLQVFITNSANVFLLETVPVPGAQRRDAAELVKRLEDQVSCQFLFLMIFLQ